MLELLPEARDEISDLRELYVKSSTTTGRLIRLDSFCTFDDTLGYLTVNHTNQLPSVTISFNLAPGYSLLEATNAIKEVAVKELPESVTGRFQGMASEFEESLIDLGLLLLLCIFIILYNTRNSVRGFSPPSNYYLRIALGYFRRSADADFYSGKSWISLVLSD